MPDWIGLLMVLGFVTIILLVYMLITRSAGIYATPRQFWQVLIFSTGISYLLSGGLFLFFHLSTAVAVAVSAIVPFLVGNLDLGGNVSQEPAPTDAGREMDQPEADEAEADGPEDAEEGEAFLDDGDDKGPKEGGLDKEVLARGPGEIDPLWN